MKLLIFIYFLKFTFFTFYSRLYNYGKSDCYPVGPTFSREIHEYVWVSSTQLKKKKIEAMSHFGVTMVSRKRKMNTK